MNEPNARPRDEELCYSDRLDSLATEEMQVQIRGTWVMLPCTGCNAATIVDARRSPDLYCVVRHERGCRHLAELG